MNSSNTLQLYRRRAVYSLPKLQSAITKEGETAVFKLVWLKQTGYLKGNSRT